jgi:excinuclease ABC subunit C
MPTTSNAETDFSLEWVSPYAEKLKDIRRRLPENPGIYKYRDEEGKIIYVGKAVNLKRRVNSYFNRPLESLDFKTRLLVKKIADIEFVITNDEMEALLLENNLIKQHQPKYNIALRDGKSYPYICVTNERFPRVFATRKRIQDGSTYYGPYPTGGAMYTLLDFIQSNYKLRNCTYNLSEANIKAGKFRPCLDYQIGKCKAPCVAYQSEEEYNEDIRQIRQILKGNFKAVIDEIKARIDHAVANLQFETAYFLKNRIEQIQKYKRKNTIVSDSITDVEVVTLVSRQNLTVINHFKILNGTIIRTHSFDVWRKNEETEGEILRAVLSHLASDDPDFNKKVVSNYETDEDYSDILNGITVTVPAKGDLQKVVALSVKNCEAVLDEKTDVSRIPKRERMIQELLEQAQKDLRLTKPPIHIECFDNSHMQGDAPVSSCVVFKNGKPSKKDYRVFNVKTVVGIDDFATMYEAVYRRYKRYLDDQKPLPDLVVIDGGKGQLSSAIRALTDLGIETQLPVISIAKRLEEIYYKDDPDPMYIDKKSPTLKLLQRIRNEAHDTAINGHRDRRSKKSIQTELTGIKGIGQATAKLLLAELGSVKKVKEADEARLRAVIGPAKAKLVYSYFHPQTQ